MSTDLVLAFFSARRAALEAQCQASDFADSIFERNMGHVDGIVAALKATRTDMPFAQASRLRLQCVNTAELVRDSIRSDEHFLDWFVCFSYCDDNRLTHACRRRILNALVDLQDCYTIAAFWFRFAATSHRTRSNVAHASGLIQAAFCSTALRRLYFSIFESVAYDQEARQELDRCLRDNQAFCALKQEESRTHRRKSLTMVLQLVLEWKEM